VYNGLLPDGDNQQQDEETMAVLTRIVVNALLYLCSELPAEEMNESRQRRERRDELLAAAKRKKSRKKALRDERKASRISPMSVVWLGRSVEESVSEGGSHASPRQHWVTGHWHAYWHGPGKTLRKLNWVKPFLRGDPQRGQTEVRVHRTGEGE